MGTIKNIQPIKGQDLIDNWQVLYQWYFCATVVNDEKQKILHSSSFSHPLNHWEHGIAI